MGWFYDADAVHAGVAGEISGLATVTPASNDHVMIEDASDSNRKKQVAASAFLSGGGGGGGAMTKIAVQTLASAGTITFSSIAATFESLLIVGQLRSALAGTTGDQFGIRVGNGTVDSGAAAYGWQVHLAGEIGTTEFQDLSDSEIEVTGSIPSDGLTSGLFSAVEIRIPDYASMTRLRSVLVEAGYVDVGNSIRRMVTAAGTWDNSADAIDTIEVFSITHASNHLAAGSSLALYGLS